MFFCATNSGSSKTPLGLRGGTSFELAVSSNCIEVPFLQSFHASSVIFILLTAVGSVKRRKSRCSPKSDNRAVKKRLLVSIKNVPGEGDMACNGERRVSLSLFDIVDLTDFDVEFGPVPAEKGFGCTDRFPAAHEAGTGEEQQRGSLFHVE